MQKYGDGKPPIVYFHKGYDIYVGFTKWEIAKGGVLRPERFVTYKDATDYIDKNLVSREIDISKFISHADSLRTTEMKKIFLTVVGYKQVEKNIILSNIFYVSYGDYLLLVPFYLMRNGKIIKKGVNLFSFLQQNKMTKIKEIFKKDVTVLGGKIVKNNITIYDCSKIEWEKLLYTKPWIKWMKNRETCPLDN